jgi:hypothetical protein
MIVKEIVETEDRYIQNLNIAITVNTNQTAFSHQKAFLDPIEDKKLTKNKDFLDSVHLFKDLHQAHKQAFSSMNVNNSSAYDVISMFYKLVHPSHSCITLQVEQDVTKYHVHQVIQHPHRRD